MTDMENMATRQKPQGLWSLSSILQPQFFVILRNLTHITFRFSILIFTFPRITTNPLWLIEIHEANRARGTIALQPNKRIFALLPVILPVVPRTRVPLCFPLFLRTGFPSFLLFEEERENNGGEKRQVRVGTKSKGGKQGKIGARKS